MSKKARIKDIAQMAGVSVGTVDRVIHNRGNVAPEVEEAINQILKKVNYTPNLHVSSISMHKTYRIIVIIPIHDKGEYWWQIQQGIEQAIRKYDNIDIVCEFSYYNQFDLYSSKSVFESVLKQEPNAVIIGPTFMDETLLLCKKLDEDKIPYVFVDAMPEHTNPVTSYLIDQYSCGHLIAKMVFSGLRDDQEVILFQEIRIGDKTANNTIKRKEGFFAFCEEKNKMSKVHLLNFSPQNPTADKDQINAFLSSHPQIGGAVVLSSRGGVIAQHFAEEKINHIKLLCLDLTEVNKIAIESEKINYILCQRPYLQGFMAIKSLITCMCFGKQEKTINLLPIDILTKENLPYYREFIDIE